MTLKAPRLGEVLAGISGALLLVSLFLPWYGVDGAVVSGWDSLRTLRFVLLVCSALGILLLLLEITQRASPVPVALSAVIGLVGIVATLWVALRLLQPPGDGWRLEFAWLGLAAVIGVAAGGLISGRDEGTDFWPGQEQPPPGGPG
jgi:hypothetical protein